MSIGRMIDGETSYWRKCFQHTPNLVWHNDRFRGWYMRLCERFGTRRINAAISARAARTPQTGEGS